MQIRKAFWVFISIALVSLFIAIYAGRFSNFPDSRIVFYRLAILALLLIIVNFFWTLIATKKIAVLRRQRVLRLPVGNMFEERFDVVNQSKLWRLWVEIEDLSGLPGNTGSKVLSQISPRQDRFYVSRTLLIKRGAYTMSPTLLRSGDPFGMFLSEKVFESDKTLVVLPYFENIEKIKQPIGLYIGGETVRQKSLQATSIAAGVREYQPGDPLNRIHWRSSAKRGHFMVKEFEQDPQGDTWILLDSNANFHYEKKLDLEVNKADSFWAWRDQEQFKLPVSTFEYAISICATLANYFTKTDKAVGFASADQRMIILAGEKGERQFGKIMDTLAFLEGKGKMPLGGLIESLSSQIPRGSTVFLVSAAPVSSNQIGIEVLLRKRLNPVMVNIDSNSFDANFSEAAETPASAQIPFPHVNIRYGDNIAEKLQTLFH
ncbi:MAG: hypothetical protein BGO78_01635 [Chloroflexi bacterium 44-23]|nr:MAG: hypothetical protein BGO78_01635 [Chloroflexi bacterium 44-23]